MDNEYAMCKKKWKEVPLAWLLWLHFKVATLMYAFHIFPFWLRPFFESIAVENSESIAGQLVKEMLIVQHWEGSFLWEEIVSIEGWGCILAVKAWEQRKALPPCYLGDIFFTVF